MRKRLEEIGARVLEDCRLAHKTEIVRGASEERNFSRGVDYGITKLLRELDSTVSGFMHGQSQSNSEPAPICGGPDLSHYRDNEELTCEPERGPRCDEDTSRNAEYPTTPSFWVPGPADMRFSTKIPGFVPEEYADVQDVEYEYFAPALQAHLGVPLDSILRSHPVVVVVGRIILVPGYRALPDACQLIFPLVSGRGEEMRIVIHDCLKLKDSAFHDLNDITLGQTTIYLGQRIEYLDASAPQVIH